MSETIEELMNDPEIADLVDEIAWLAWFLRAWGVTKMSNLDTPDRG